MVGGLCVGLGILGAVLPLLPTTPFILLASACFMRGSPRFHHWIIHHPTFGTFIRDWQEKRALRRSVKHRAMALIVLSFTVSIYFSPFLWLKIALLIFAIVLLLWFVQLPVIEHLADDEENH